MEHQFAGSKATYIGGFIVEGTFQELALESIHDVTYVNDKVKVQNATTLAGEKKQNQVSANTNH